MLKNIDNKENDRSNLSAWQVLFMPQLPLQGWASNKLAWNISRCPSTAHPTLIFFLTLVLIRWFQTFYFFFPTAKNIQSYGDTSKFWVSLCSSTAVSNVASMCSHIAVSSDRPLLKTSTAGIPFVWIRRLILFSDGCGMLYPQNTTSGLHIKEKAKHQSSKTSFI